MCFAWYSSCNTDPDTQFTPVLISPSNGAVLDNGDHHKSDLMTWVFDWEDCAGATKYHLYVKHPEATDTVINIDDIINSEYTKSEYAYVVDRNRYDWKWNVHAMVNGVWGPSTTQSFDVEPLDTDCNP